MEEENVYDWDYGEDGHAFAACLEIGDKLLLSM
jgi:hypothetical protein